MNEKKPTVIVARIAYDPTGDTHHMDIFTPKQHLAVAA